MPYICPLLTIKLKLTCASACYVDTSELSDYLKRSSATRVLLNRATTLSGHPLRVCTDAFFTCNDKKQIDPSLKVKTSETSTSSNVPHVRNLASPAHPSTISSQPCFSSSSFNHLFAAVAAHPSTISSQPSQPCFSSSSFNHLFAAVSAALKFENGLPTP